MRKLGLATVAVLMSTAAYAGDVHEFAIGGGKVRIEMRDCKRGTCPWVSWDKSSTSKSTSSNRDTKTSKYDDEDDRDYRDKPVSKNSKPAARTETAKAPAKNAANDDYDDDDDYDDEKPAEKGTSTAAGSAPVPAAAPVVTPAPRSEDIAARLTTPREPAPAPPMPTEGARAPAPVSDAPMWKDEPRQRIASLTPEPVETSRTEPALAPVKTAKLVGPIGEWVTEDGEGRVLVEPCGANLCGKVSHAKNPNDTDRNNPDRDLRRRSVIGMPVLMDMKPRGERWEGQVYNAKDGKTYTAKIAMKSANTMRIEGCIMNGMLCGGQNWKRAQ